MQSMGMIDLLEAHRAELVDYCFVNLPDFLPKVGDCISSFPVHIVLGNWYQDSRIRILMGC